VGDTDLVIERLTQTAAQRDVRGLALLLVDAVESGAAVSFVLPLSIERAEEWWRAVVQRIGTEGGPVVLVARDGAGDIRGTVQLHPAWAPNQPHRADVAKLIVHRRARGAGLGSRLMAAVEQTAREAGFTLLVLDAKRGGAAERLYRRLGWTAAGIIPRYALDPDGKSLHDTVVFYKEPDGRRKADLDGTGGA
jgi:GNAT superfamily N-acetyltransferase